MEASKKKPRKPSLASRLRKAGFDLAHYDRSTGYTYPKCSCCQALVINGVATHERGCPNQPRHEDDDE